MLTEICLWLRNWFDCDRKFGTFTIEDGKLNIEITENQYYRIVGSVFNDGVYQSGKDTLTDETFEGAVWLMAVPPDVIEIANEIAAWMAKYGTTDSAALSPFQSESFGGYSYTKASGGNSGNSNVPTWQNVFGARLGRYRKI